MPVDLDRKPQIMPPGNQWLYDNRNALLSPRSYKFHTGDLRGPSGVLKDFAEFAQAEIIKGSWTFRDVLVSQLDAQSPVIVVVFEHNSTDTLKQVKDETLTDPDALADFVRHHAIDPSNWSLKLDLAEVFEGTAYDVRSSGVGLNTLKYNVHTRKRKNLFWTEPHVYPGFWVQQGVGYVLAQLEHLDSKINREQMVMRGNQTSHGIAMQSYERELANLRKQIVQVEERRAQRLISHEAKNEEIQARIDALEARKADAYKSLI